MGKEMSAIELHKIKLETGNTLQIQVNNVKKSISIDLIHANENGGFEFVRRTFDQAELLSHLELVTDKTEES